MAAIGVSNLGIERFTGSNVVTCLLKAKVHGALKIRTWPVNDAALHRLLAE